MNFQTSACSYGGFVYTSKFLSILITPFHCSQLVLFIPCTSAIWTTVAFYIQPRLKYISRFANVDVLHPCIVCNPLCQNSHMLNTLHKHLSGKQLRICEKGTIAHPQSIGTSMKLDKNDQNEI
jgi:hypothetical protein